MFYRDPTIDIKCTYQNLKLVHVRLDMTKVGSQTLHVRLKVVFVKRTKRRTCKINDSDA